MLGPPGRSARELVEALSATPGVAWAEPMGVYRTHAAAYNDPLYPVQPAARLWRLEALHEISSGEKVRVAVIDSQVDLAHPDLKGQVALAADFVDRPAVAAERHGTGVAGVIAARANNAAGIVGVAPNARLLALRACWEAPDSGPGAVCDSLSLAKALVFAIDHRAEVINLSLSGPPGALLSRLIDAALARGDVVVGAYDPQLPKGGFPASHAGVIAVSDRAPAPPSVYAAPGRDVPVPEPGGRWGLADGSSYAAAHISGLLALMRRHGAVSKASLVVAPGAPAGAVDACASLLHAFGPCGCACARVAAAGPRS
jgi:subtilisin family serine protease